MPPLKYQKAPPRKAATRPIQPWAVGAALRDARTEQGLDVEALSKKTISVDPERKGVQATRIDELELRAVPDLKELFLLCASLNVSPRDLLSPAPEPWILVCGAKMDAALKKAPKLLRVGGAHQYMIERRKKYRYVPLDVDDDVSFDLSSDRNGDFRPVMRKFLFEVDHADDETISAGLDAHQGEEIVYVLSGTIEFFLKQPDSDEVKKLTLHKGDCLHYSSRVYHGYRSASARSIARALFVYVEPKSPTPVQFVREPEWRKRLRKSTAPKKRRP